MDFPVFPLQDEVNKILSPVTVKVMFWQSQVREFGSSGKLIIYFDLFSPLNMFDFHEIPSR